MRAAVRHLSADPVLESRQERQGEDERGDTDGKTHDGDRGNERDVGAPSRSGEIAQSDERLEPHRQKGLAAPAFDSRFPFPVSRLIVRAAATETESRLESTPCPSAAS